MGSPFNRGHIMQSKPSTDRAPMRSLVRLEADEIRKLEAQLPQPVLNNSTTPQETGYLLGIQAVLRQLREGWLVGY